MQPKSERPKKASANTTRKGGFLSLKKAWTPFGSHAEQSLQDPKSSTKSRRQSMESLHGPSSVQAAAGGSEAHAYIGDKPSTNEPEMATTKGDEALPTFRGITLESDCQHQPNLRRLQKEAAKFRTLASNFQEKLGKIEMEKRIADETSQRKIQLLEEQVLILYKERDDARKVTTQLLEALPEQTMRAIQEQASTGGKASDDSHAGSNKQEVAETLERLKHRKDVEPLERRIFALETKCRKMENRNDELRAQHEAFEVDLKFKTLECDDLNHHVSSCEEDVKSLSARLGQALKERNEAINERNRIRIQLDRFVVKRATEVAVVDSYYFDDAYFKSQFCILRNTIKDWSNQAFSESSSTKKIKPLPAATQKLSVISKDWESYMGSDLHRPTLVQAYVWNFLFSCVFGGQFWEFPSKEYSKFLEEKNPRGIFFLSSSSSFIAYC